MDLTYFWDMSDLSFMGNKTRIEVLKAGQQVNYSSLCSWHKEKGPEVLVAQFDNQAWGSAPSQALGLQLTRQKEF